MLQGACEDTVLLLDPHQGGGTERPAPAWGSRSRWSRRARAGALHSSHGMIAWQGLDWITRAHAELPGTRRVHADTSTQPTSILDEDDDHQSTAHGAAQRQAEHGTDSLTEAACCTPVSQCHENLRKAVSVDDKHITASTAHREVPYPGPDSGVLQTHQTSAAAAQVPHASSAHPSLHLRL